MKENLKDILPKEITESTDPDMFRALREFSNSEVRRLEQERTERDLDKYRPKYEGKYILEYGTHCMKIAIPQCPNKKDIYIVRVHSIKSVGYGFLSCDATVLRIKYGDTHEKLRDGGLSANNFDEVKVCSYDDTDYRFNYENEPTVLSDDQVQEYINTALADVSNSFTWFKEQKSRDGQEKETSK